ncbi:MAG TPA: biotin/lipoyl-containing protein [Candidatus Limnocylindria bacterium]|nr:biotin/lipoyl-containing protein [Candidatus Limnocylindria bacterium]
MTDLRERANALVAELLERVGRDGVRELEVRRAGLRVRVVAAGASAAAVAVPAAPTAAQGTAPIVGAPPKPAADGHVVQAPLTGVFYRSSSPQAPPLVQVGSVVAPGDVVGLIEAMKLFNEIRATVGGRVKRIVAENGKLVRAHQPILELE